MPDRLVIALSVLGVAFLLFVHSVQPVPVRAQTFKEFVIAGECKRIEQDASATERLWVCADGSVYDENKDGRKENVFPHVQQ